MEKFKVAAVQFEHAPGDKDANFEKIGHFAAAAARESAEAVIFPECCIVGYWHLRHLSRHAIADLAEAVPAGPSSGRLMSIAEKHGVTVGAGLLEKSEEGRFYNTYVVAMPDGRFARHRKIHAFISEHVSCGCQFTVFDLPNGWRAGLLVCYDNNIVENVRITALAGADVIFAPHQTGGCASKNPHQMGLVDRALWDNRRSDPEAIEAEFRGDKGRGWLMRWLPSRAHDSGVFLVFANGVGVDDDEIRTGNAMILDPYGRILAETWKADDDMVTAVLDPALFIQCTGRRWMRSRRPDLYGALCERTGREEDTRKVRFDEDGLLA